MSNNKRRPCIYKKRMTKDEAYGLARKSWRTRQLLVYKCQFCDGYHLAKHKFQRMEFLFSLLDGNHEV